MKKNKKDKKIIDIIIFIVLAALVILMAIFTITRKTANQEIVLMEIYKCAGPNTSTASMSHYYVFSNTSTVKIRDSNSDGSITTVRKAINQDLIDNFKKALDEYISTNPSMNTSFYTNERYAIEYESKTIIVPNPTVANNLGFDGTEYTFYNTVENFINTMSN